MDALVSDQPSGLLDIDSYLNNFNKDASDPPGHTYIFGGDNSAPSPVYTDLGLAYPASQTFKGGRQTADGAADGVQGTTEGNSLLASQESSYQTLTIVPSAVNGSGEVSYMLIVSQDAEGSGGGGSGSGGDHERGDMEPDLSVFDFKEEGGGVRQDEEDEDVEEEEEEEDLEQPMQKPAHKPVQKPKPARKQGRTARASMEATTPVAPSISLLMCSYCNYTSTKRFLLQRHMRAHSLERPHKCSLCGRAFKNVPALQNHINTHTGVKPNKCKECDSAFTTSGELIRHVRYRHTYEKPHRCTECDYASVERSKLQRHIRSHTGERPYQCPHCLYASPDTFKLKRHLRVHSGEKPYVCDICDMRFTQSNSRKSHMLLHGDNKPIFQCELCPSTCTRKTDLKNHVLKIHTSAEPLQCKKCGKSFPDRYTYKIHARTHDGQKCFRCELCPYEAHMQRHLESHILTHTGEKPYQCHRCDVAFRQKQLLKRHVNLYHNPSYRPPSPTSRPHACTECDRTFKHRGNLLNHLALHFPDNPQYCADLAEGAQEGGDGEEEQEEGQGYEEAEEGMEEGEQEFEGGYVEMSSNAPVQVQLMNEQASSEVDEPVYLQLDSHPQAATPRVNVRTIADDGNLGDISLQEDGEGAEEMEATPLRQKIVKRGRGRPRKNSLQAGLSDEDLSSPAATPRRRGKAPKSPRAQSAKATAEKKRKVCTEEQEEEEGNDLEKEAEYADADENHEPDMKSDSESTPVGSKRYSRSGRMLIKKESGF